ncbi:DUF6801 domain-containing protein [Amycolatopsis sp. WAC 04182]|uniref:DUF6801 domain-containing protein n=1 Tax=Amycolatopsis sp. WAC 04182 TaxID=2203198 RepID=UPI003513C8AC
MLLAAGLIVLLTAGCLLFVAVRSAAAGTPVDKKLSFTCPFPLIGLQKLDVNIKADFEVPAAPGGTLTTSGLTITVTVPDKAARGLNLVGATTIEGTAAAGVTLVNGDANPLPVRLPLNVAKTDIPPSGTFSPVATGSVPTITLAKPGKTTLTVGDFTTRLTPKKADGSFTGLGSFTSDCTLDPGQDPGPALLRTRREARGAPIRDRREDRGQGTRCRRAADRHLRAEPDRGDGVQRRSGVRQGTRRLPAVRLSAGLGRSGVRRRRTAGRRPRRDRFRRATPVHHRPPAGDARRHAGQHRPWLPDVGPVDGGTAHRRRFHHGEGWLAQRYLLAGAADRLRRLHLLREHARPGGRQHLRTRADPAPGLVVVSGGSGSGQERLRGRSAALGPGTPVATAGTAAAREGPLLSTQPKKLDLHTFPST